MSPGPHNTQAHRVGQADEYPVEFTFSNMQTTAELLLPAIYPARRPGTHSKAGETGKGAHIVLGTAETSLPVVTILSPRFLHLVCCICATEIRDASCNGKLHYNKCKYTIRRFVLRCVSLAHVLRNTLAQLHNQ